jgi:hypothetical protein
MTTKNLLMTAPAGGFTDPTDIAGLTVWHDASDATTITDTAGAVTQWDDKSVNGYNLTPPGGVNPTTGTRTINSLNAIDFVSASSQDVRIASANFMDGTNGTFTLFAAFEADVTGGSRQVVSSDSPTSVRGPQTLKLNGTTLETLRIQNSSGSTDVVADSAGTAISTAVTTVAVVQHRALGVLEAWMNGSSNGSTSDASPAANRDAAMIYVIGSSGRGGEFFDGLVGEVVTYGAVLSSADINTVANYLATKWGGTWSDI